MTSDLIVDVSSKYISTAVLEDQELVILQRERRDLAFVVGDIYLGRVKRVVPGMNAAFVDVGSDKDAFISAADLGAKFLTLQWYLDYISKGKEAPALSKAPQFPDLPKGVKVEDYLKVDQLILVQVKKEAISGKGPRLSCEIALAGSHFILSPFSDKVSISSKIRSTREKERLKQLTRCMKPANMSVIVRTSAEGKDAADLDPELRRLLGRWDEIVETLSKKQRPALIGAEASRTLSYLRDTFNKVDYNSIEVNDKDYYEDIREYISMIAPGQEGIVKLYQGNLPLFDAKGITKQIKKSFGKNVYFKGGAYLIIEHTEAMHVIDVNSGDRARKNTKQEETALDVNLAAAEEIARQLRLRDLGGIIVVDFIDMQQEENRKKLCDHMRELMKNDVAKHHVLKLSKFGVMEITRQRVRPALEIRTSENCPSCQGTGKISSSIMLTETIESSLRDIVEHLGLTYIDIHVHPYVAAYLNQGFFFTIARSWKWKIARGIRITPNESLAFLDYKFLNKDGEEIGEVMKL